MFVSNLLSFNDHWFTLINFQFFRVRTKTIHSAGSPRHHDPHTDHGHCSIHRRLQLKDRLSGSGVVIYHQNRPFHTIFHPLGETTISYAELFSAYLLLQWLHSSYRNPNHTQVHIFTDSFNTQYSLCRETIPETDFTLVEEIKNLAERLTKQFSLTIHWIPSHIEMTSFGKPIQGNIAADKLATSVGFCPLTACEYSSSRRYQYRALM